MIKSIFSAPLKMLKQVLFSKNEESTSHINEENEADGSCKEQSPPFQSQTKNKADVLVFDTKKRIFVVKKRRHSVAIYDPENYKISSKKENKEQSTIEFKNIMSGTCLPFSGNWYHAEQTDMGLYCTETGSFYLHNNEKNTIQTIQNNFHDKQHDTVPITGDWQGNGKKSIGVFNKTISTFFIKSTAKENTEDIVFSFGSEEHKCTPLIGDWNGDGKDTIGLYLPKQGVFFLHNSLDVCLTADMSFHFGPQNSTFIPLVGDWNGDGKDTIGLYDPEQGLFFLHNKNEGTDKLDYSFHFGPANKKNIPIIGDWQGEGKTGIGIYNPEKATFYLSQSLSGGSAEIEVTFPKETKEYQPFTISYIV